MVPPREDARSNFWRRAEEKDIGLVWCLAPGGGHGCFGTLLAFIAWCLDGVSSCSKSPDVPNGTEMTLSRLTFF